MHDAEIAAVINSVFDAIHGLPQPAIHISDRRIVRDLLDVQGVADGRARAEVLAMIDRGRQMTDAELEQALAGRVYDPHQVIALLEARSFGDAQAILREVDAPVHGLESLKAVVEYAEALGVPRSRLVVDYRVVRGFDYYTRTVFETYIEGQAWPSVCFGGRYDHLANDLPRHRHFPGVGISIDATSLFEWMHEAGLVQTTRKTRADVLVTMQDRVRHRDAYLGLARRLRSAGIRTELYLEPHAYDLQIQHAVRSGVPLVVHAERTDIDRRQWVVVAVRGRSPGVAVADDQIVDHLRALVADLGA
jgi:histidyl-tRNA synthetase